MEGYRLEDYINPNPGKFIPESDTDKVWNEPMPIVHSKGNLLLESGKHCIYAYNDGETWGYTHHIRQGEFCPQVGKTFVRQGWNYNASRNRFNAWFARYIG